MEVIRELKSLRVLVLAKTEVDDVGLQALAAHRRLENLDISFTRATRTSLESLNGLTSLKKLNIKGTRIGLTNLVVLKRLGNIEVSYLDEQFTFQETSLLRIMQADAKHAATEVDKLIEVCKSGTSDERVRAIMRLCDLTLYDDRAEHVIRGKRCQEVFVATSPLQNHNIWTLRTNVRFPYSASPLLNHGNRLKRVESFA